MATNDELENQLAALREQAHVRERKQAHVRDVKVMVEAATTTSAPSQVRENPTKQRPKYADSVYVTRAPEPIYPPAIPHSHRR